MFVRILLFLCIGLVELAGAAPLLVKQSGFQTAADGMPAGWNTWAARAEIAPRTFVDAIHYRRQPGSLAISGNSNTAAYGGWVYTARSIEPGKWYRLIAYYRAEGLESDRRQVVVRLDWARPNGGRAGWPDYAYQTERMGEWTRISLDAPAPDRAAAVKLQLYLQNAPYATIWWDEISLEEIPTPAPRPVRIASINLRPKDTHSARESVEKFMEAAEKVVEPGADMILFPEGITMVGNNQSFAVVAESLPGPTTERLGTLARTKKAYVVAGVYEREGIAIYNTAVLIDRAGRLIGKYRKVYLPRDEVDGGLTPGNDYPVFRTDFGRIGFMICWDVQYADPARALALAGAEIVLMPIWGGNEMLTKARAIENRVFLVSSGYDHPTAILDPDGNVIAMAREQGTAAVATLDLNRRYLNWWDGDMRQRFMKEVRLDLSVEPR